MPDQKSGLSRREFLQGSGMLFAGFAAGQTNPRKTGLIARPLLKLDALEKFVDALPIPGQATPSGMRPQPGNPARKIPYYRLAIRQFEGKIHRDVPATRLW